MKFIAVSDMHLLTENPEARLDNLVDVQFAKFEFILGLARKEDAAILQAGDMFNKPRSWMLLPVVIDLLKKYGVKIYGVRGQHDDYMYSDETRERTTLGILEKVGLVIALNPEKPIRVQGIDLFGANFGQELAQIERSCFTVGIIHAGISDAALWPGHQFTAADKYLYDHPGYDFILVGDIHRTFDVYDPKTHRQLINVGPMLRKEATEYNLQHKPSVYLLDTDDRKKSRYIEIPHTEATKILSRDHIERKTEAEGLLDEFVDSIKSGKDENLGVSFVENLLKFTKENNVDKSVMDVLARYIGTKREGL